MDRAALFTPSLSGHVPRAPSDAWPWRPESQVYVALLGGPIALTIVAVLNAPRLRMPPRSRVLLLLAGAIGAIAGAIAAANVGSGTSPRLLIQVAGALTYAPVFWLQRAHGRAHSAFSGQEDDELDWDSLWGPGAAAVVAGLIAELALVGALGGLG